jgi:hypothetical protein
MGDAATVGMRGRRAPLLPAEQQRVSGGSPPAGHRSPGDEGRGDAEARQREVEQVVRAAVERARGDDVRAGAGDRRDRQMQAAWPLAVAIAPLPPSRAATRSSRTALVGFESRL